MTTPYRLLTIASVTCAGATTLAEHVSEALTWSIDNPVSKEVRKYLHLNKLTLADVDKVPDEIHVTFDQIMKQQIHHDQHKVIVGRTTGWLAEGLSDVYKIFVTASPDERIKRYAVRESLTLEQARQQLLENDQKNKSRYQRQYKIDYQSPSWYNLIVDTTSITSNQALKLVLSNMQRK